MRGSTKSTIWPAEFWPGRTRSIRRCPSTEIASQESSNKLFFQGEPLVLAHRGASAYAPENTLTAFRLSLEQGADAIETDCHVTRDGIPVLQHAGDLSEATEGRGPIRGLSLDELRSYDAGYRWSDDDGQTHPYRGRGERVPTLAEALETFPEARFNVDIKDRHAARAAREVIDAHDAADRVLLASWYSWRRRPATLGYSGPCSVTLDQMLLYMPLVWSRLDRLWTPSVDALQVPELYRGLRVVTPRLVEAAHRAGVRVHVWTVDEEAEMARLLEWGVDGIVTKRPDVAVEVRERFLLGKTDNDNDNDKDDEKEEED